MRNVFYVNCAVDPWIKVAKKLQETENLKPVYWNGYSFVDNANILVKEAFPDILFCEDADSWRGRFPKEIIDRANETSIDIDFLRKFASEELQAIKMMDRMDYDLYSLNFQERQRLFRNMVRSWMAAISWLKPAMIISQVMPHHVSDYVLYLLCQYYHIPYFFPEHTPFYARFIIPCNLYTIGNIFNDDYEEALKKSDKELLDGIPQDMLERYNKIKEGYANGAPTYMARENKMSKRYSHFGGLVWHFIQYFRNLGSHQPLFGKKGMLWHGVIVYYRKDRKWIEESRFSLWKFCFMHISAGRLKKKMLKYYNTFISKADYSEPYVLFALHYQPEATSNPGGDIFVDQRLVIDMLLKNLPSEYKVYVKEHPHQFLKQRDGQTCRIKEFYEDLSKNPRIKLIDINESTFNLILHSKAVATIKGTIGWESMIYGKPVIDFGISWYETYNGVLRIMDEESAKKMEKFITEFKFDEHNLLAFLYSVGIKTYRTYYSNQFNKDGLSVTEEETVSTLSEILTDYLHSYEKC